MALVGTRLVKVAAVMLLVLGVSLGSDEEDESPDPPLEKQESHTSSSDEPSSKTTEQEIVEPENAEPENAESGPEQEGSESSEPDESVPYKRLPLEGQMSPNQNVDLPQDI